eukprot:9136167-Alexandrium_andersonii.AAC.1
MPPQEGAPPQGPAGTAPDAAPSRGGGAAGHAPGALVAGLLLNEAGALRRASAAQRRGQRLVEQRRIAFRNVPASRRAPSEDMLTE